MHVWLQQQLFRSKNVEVGSWMCLIHWCRCSFLLVVLLCKLFIVREWVYKIRFVILNWRNFFHALATVIGRVANSTQAAIISGLNDAKLNMSPAPCFCLKFLWLTSEGRACHVVKQQHRISAAEIGIKTAKPFRNETQPFKIRLNLR